MRGTVAYLSLIITCIVSIVLVFAVLAVINILVFAHGKIAVDVTKRFIYLEPKSENSLMVFLESTHEGMRMRDWLTYAVYLNRVGNIEVSGKSIMLKDASRKLMNKISKNYMLRLAVDGSVHELASSGRLEKPQRAEYIIQAGDETGRLELLIEG
jgi:hypothetical protein